MCGSIHFCLNTQVSIRHIFVCIINFLSTSLSKVRFFSLVLLRWNLELLHVSLFDEVTAANYQLINLGFTLSTKF